MKKLFTFLLALMASSCLWAEITYELDGGKYNDYDWNNKGDMFAAFMTDAGATGFETLDYYKASDSPLKGSGICSKMTTPEKAFENQAKWGWLKDYIRTVQNAQTGAPTLDDTGKGSTWYYAVGAFFVEMELTSWPYSADFTEAGKDAAYIPSWGQNYGNPTAPTEEVTLVEPYRAGYLFDGWYDNEACTGTPVTKVNQNTTGTIYAKWVLDGIVYELNGGKYNDYGWTSKADICYGLQADYNSAYSKSLSWAKKENGVVYYNIDGTWMTETEAKGQEANVAKFLQATTYNTTNNLLTIVEDTHKAKYGWLKDVIVANRQAQSLGITIDEALYRKELSAFFLCSPKNTSYPTNSSYETTGDYEDFQPYWGQAFPNPEHPTAEVVLNNPVKAGYKFLGWYDNEACTGTPITKVDQNTKGTLYAKWVLEGIVYELNGGVWNQYGWENKSDMFAACMAEAGVTGLASLDELKAAGAASFTTICTPLDATKCQVILDSDKWEWLEQYIMSVQNPQKGTIVGGGAIAELTANTADAGWRFAIAAFFLEMQNTAWPRTADFSEAGKDAAYIPAWGQSYGNPEHPTTEVELYAPIKVRHTFAGWYANEDFSGNKVTKVNADYAGTLYAKWNLAPVLYELNGGQYNEYGWESKKDMYEDLNVDWNAFANKTNTWPAYETVYGVGNSNNGVAGKTDATFSTFFTNASYKDKWGWMVTYLDAIATKQGKTLPSTDAIPLRWGVGNFLCDDNNGSTTWHKAVDCTGEDGQLYTAQAYCSFTLPNPMYPTKEVTLNNPTKEGYIFDGWYANADFSGAKVTKVNADTKGTLYAKWNAVYTRDVTNGNYGTICLPNGSNQMTGAIFFEIAYRDGSYVYLDQVTELVAGMPYIFRATSNQIQVMYNSTYSATAVHANGLYGTFAAMGGTDLVDKYVITNNTIKKCLAGSTLKANRAYIEVDHIDTHARQAAPGRQRVAMGYQGENEATGVDNVNGMNPAMEGVYDVMGRKLTEPTSTGFYIINGKKVFVVK